MELIKKSLYRIAQFYDRKKVGEDGRFGFKRSSDLMTLYRCLDVLLEKEIIKYKESVFLDIGCADGRVNLFFSYITKLSIGIEIDEWSIDESRILFNELSYILKKEGLLLPSDNIHLYHGDVFDPEVYKKIKDSLGFDLKDVDVVYTYLFMYREFGEFLKKEGKQGVIFMLYGTGNIVPKIDGFVHLRGLSLPENIAIYKKV